MRSLSLLLASFLFLASCGASDPASLTDSGMQRLRSGAYEEAVTHFENALAAIGPHEAHPEFKRARMGAIQARLHFDAEDAKADFLDLHSRLESKITDIDYQRIANAMGGAKEFLVGIDVLVAGQKAFPESRHLDRVGQSLAKMSKEAGDAEAVNKLKSLGYL